MIIKYDPSLNELISLSSVYMSSFLVRMHPDRFLLDVLDKILDVSHRLHIDERKIGQVLAYAIGSTLSPVYDFSLLAANIVRRKIEKKQETEPQSQVEVALLDWNMLPAALLLDNVNRFYLPPDVIYPLGIPMREAQNEYMAQEFSQIHAALRELFPNTDWTSEYPHKNSLILGTIKSSASNETWQEYVKKIADSAGGACYVTWDFLGLKKNAHLREKLLATKEIAGILQLPRPRRQNDVLFPALIDLEPESETIRAAEILDVSLFRPGDMDQEKALKLLYGPCAENERCDDFSRESIMTSLSNLLPSEMLSRKNTELQEGEIRLRDCAQVLRCQLKREKICAAPCNDIENLPKTNAVRCYEVSLAARDPDTGFVYPKRGAVVELGMEQLGANEKYLLQQNDIILAFRGTRETVGEVGIMARRWPPDHDQPIDKVITGQSICIIRAYGETNPVWLYFYLRQPEVRQMIKDRSAGLSVLNINLDALRELPVKLPSEYESEAIKPQFNNLRIAMSKIEHQKKRAEDILKEISDIFQED